VLQPATDLEPSHAFTEQPIADQPHRDVPGRLQDAGPPAPFAPAPIPNIAQQRTGSTSRSPSNPAIAATHRNRMSALHSQIQSLPATASAQQWQDLLEQYVIAAAEVSKSQHG
jgi:hypothetical protein